MSFELDLLIPVYNEHADVVRETVEKARAALAGVNTQIILVDDGSAPAYTLESLGDLPGVLLVKHPHNRGYGAALKTGLLAGHALWVAITDADGTYPVADLPRLWAAREGQSMVVGARTGDVREIPFMRKFPKTLLNLFASYMAGEPVPDLNSGLRIFKRSLPLDIWGLLPNGFSFTSTTTMYALLNGLGVSFVPVDYYKRVGASSIRPIRDTARFFKIVSRLGMLFTPMKIFGPVAVLLFIVGAGKGFLRDFPMLGYVGNLAITFMLAGLQVFMMGLIGELIVHNRHVAPVKPGKEDGC